jgi:hypothetical protein
MTAIPSPGSTFVEWSGDIADNSSHNISLVLTCDKAVTAIFAPVRPAFAWWWLVAGISTIIMIIITFLVSRRLARNRLVRR